MSSVVTPENKAAPLLTESPCWAPEKADVGVWAPPDYGQGSDLRPTPGPHCCGAALPAVIPASPSQTCSQELRWLGLP